MAVRRPPVAADLATEDAPQRRARPAPPSTAKARGQHDGLHPDREPRRFLVRRLRRRRLRVEHQSRPSHAGAIRPRSAGPAAPARASVIRWIAVGESRNAALPDDPARARARMSRMSAGGSAPSRLMTPSWSDPIVVDGSAMIASTSAWSISVTIIIVAPRSATIVSRVRVERLDAALRAPAGDGPAFERSQGRVDRRPRSMILSHPPVATM